MSGQPVGFRTFDAPAFVPLAGTTGVKREADSSPEGQTSAKRTQSTLRFDTSMNLVRVTPSGQIVPPSQFIAKPSSHEDQPEDVYEQLPSASAQPAEHEVQDDDDDLFAKVFGSEAGADKSGAEATNRSNHYEGDPGEHIKGCAGGRGASTPPHTTEVKAEHEDHDNPSPKRQSKNGREPTGTSPSHSTYKGPHPVRDRTRTLKVYEKFHEKAKELIPNLHLPAHRYWIGVLNVDRKPQNAKEEKHFIWMKGNRMTTVATVWHTYQNTTMTDGFVLMLGLERVDFTDRAEELDYFNDKFICFRAVYEDDPDSKGRELAEGFPPEIVDLDD